MHTPTDLLLHDVDVEGKELGEVGRGEWKEWSGGGGGWMESTEWRKGGQEEGVRVEGRSKEVDLPSHLRQVVHHVTPSPISNSPVSNLLTSLFLKKLKTRLFHSSFPP